MKQLELSQAERTEISQLLDAMEEQCPSQESPEFLETVSVFAHEIPRRIRAALTAFRHEDYSGTFSISGWEVDQERLGPTPAHWRNQPSPSPARREELLLLMYASLLGDPFGWATQQDGHLIHDVLPIRGHEYEQIGSSSHSLLTWHTEDAFHPLRSDFLVFACLRNPYEAATTIGSIDDIDLPESVKHALFQERFRIRPDESHRPYNNSTAVGADFSDIEKLWSEPDYMAALFGDRNRPYIRVDPYFMSVADGDDEAREALDHLVKLLDDEMLDVHLDSGTFLFIDNFRIVHGRKPFEPRHDGTDRWLKRVNVTRDLRKSRAARNTLSSRLIE